MENLNQKRIQSGPCFPPKPGHFFCQKMYERSLPTSASCMPLSLAEYASVSLNIPKYSWKYLNKLFWLCLSSECARSSYVWQAFEDASDSKCTKVLKIACKGYSVFKMSDKICLAHRWHNMPQYALISLSIKDDWMLLIVAKYAWINCSDYVKVLIMPHHLRYLIGFLICRRHKMYQDSEFATI